MLTRSRLFETYCEVFVEHENRPMTEEESKAFYINYLSYFHEDVEELIYKQMRTFLEDQGLE